MIICHKWVSISPYSTKMIVHQNEPAEAVPEDAGENMHQVVEEMKEKGIVPPVRLISSSFKHN